MSIVLDGLSKRFAGRAVVDDVRLEIADGELFVLLGASGSGKSTVLRMIAGLSAIDAGTIQLMGQDVTTPDPQRVAAAAPAEERGAPRPGRPRGPGRAVRERALGRAATARRARPRSRV